MKIYLQTLSGPDEEARPRQLVLETAASADEVRGALEQIVPRLGTIAAVPPAPHEHNLELLLPKDLAELGVTAGRSEGGEALLEIRRTPGSTGPQGQADVIGLAYAVVVK